jgi:trehalose 6-phosphate synthase
MNSLPYTRDGMNLVAKEYIASQTGEPGVLILSRFCGAAENLREAIIINPYDIDGTAESLKHALEMPLGERRYRWQALLKRVHNHTAQSWSNQFLADLVGLPDMQQQKNWRSVRKHTDPFRGGIKGAGNYPE